MLGSSQARGMSKRMACQKRGKKTRKFLSFERLSIRGRTSNSPIPFPQLSSLQILHWTLFCYEMLWVVRQRQAKQKQHPLSMRSQLDESFRLFFSRFFLSHFAVHRSPIHRNRMVKSGVAVAAWNNQTVHDTTFRDDAWKPMSTYRCNGLCLWLRANSRFMWHCNEVEKCAAMASTVNYKINYRMQTDTFDGEFGSVR